MRKVEKQVDTDKEPNIGHNGANDEARVRYTERFMSLEEKIKTLKGQQKDLLNDAKAEGILKTGIRNAVKSLSMTEEQWQSAKEVQRETKEIIALFVEKDGQYSFFTEAA